MTLLAMYTGVYTVVYQHTPCEYVQRRSVNPIKWLIARTRRYSIRLFFRCEMTEAVVTAFWTASAVGASIRIHLLLPTASAFLFLIWITHNRLPS